MNFKDGLRIPLEFREGIVYVQGTSVTLDSVVTDFEDGVPAEEIVLRHEGLVLVDLFLVLAFYMSSRSAVESYLRRDAGNGPFRCIDCNAA